jgi:hypothetical protein
VHRGPETAVRPWLVRSHPDALAAWWLRHTRALGLPVDPVRRRRLLSYAAVPAAVAYAAKMLVDREGPLPPAGPAATAVASGAFLLVAYASYRAARGFARLPRAVRRHPRTALHLVYWLLVGALWIMPVPAVRAVLVPAVVVLPFVLWRCGYLLAAGARGRVEGTAFRDHLMYLFPVWGGSNVPFGKGPEFLARHAAASPDTLARTQLAGVRLVALGLLWVGVAMLVHGLVYGDADVPVTDLLGIPCLGLPRLGALIDGRQSAGRFAMWASVYGELVVDTLHIAIQGHLFVGVLRMLGFFVPRSTDRPLLAQSVVEFWNRYYVYFKELMVDCFFLPTFLRCFRSRPVLRMVAAVFAAAFVGNVYYHLLKAEVALATGDAWGVWQALESRVLYALLLAVGIAVSMHREQRRRGGARRGLPGPLRVVVVVTFIAIIRIWAAEGTAAGVVPRTRFLLTLIAGPSVPAP